MHISITVSPDKTGDNLFIAFKKVSDQVQGKIANASVSKTRYPIVEGLWKIGRAIHSNIKMNFGPLFFLYFLQQFLSLALIKIKNNDDYIGNYNSHMMSLYDATMNVILKNAIIYICLFAIYLKGNDSLTTKALPFIGAVGYRFFLSAKEKKQLHLDKRFNEAARPASCRTIEKFIEAGRACKESGSFDCFGVTGLSIESLREQKINNISVIYPTGMGNRLLGHAYCVVNLNNHFERDIKKWNGDAFIFDPWYGLLIEVEELKKDSKLLAKYPLLSLSNKRLVRCSKNIPTYEKRCPFGKRA